MRSALGVLSIAAIICAGSTLAAEPLHECSGALGAVAPPPYRASSTVLSSTPDDILLEVAVALDDPARLPASDAVGAGLVAIAPRGNVRASVVEAEIAPVGDPSRIQSVDPGSVPLSAVIIRRARHLA